MKYQVLHRTVAVVPLDKASVRSCRGRGNSCVLMMMGDRGGGKRAREEGEAARRGPGLGPPDFECQCSRSSAAAARGRESPAGGCESLALPRPSKSLHQGGEGQVGGHSARSQEPDSQTASRTARHLPTTPTVRDGKHPTFSRRQAGSQSLLAAPQLLLLMALLLVRQNDAQPNPAARSMGVGGPSNLSPSFRLDEWPPPDHLISQRTHHSAPVHLRACFRQRHARPTYQARLSIHPSILL